MRIFIQDQASDP